MTTGPLQSVQKEIGDGQTDEDLVEAASSALPGDYRHFEALVRRHRASILANCRFVVGSNDACEDLAQEVFIKTFFGMSSFERRSKFKTWIQRIKVNHCLDHLRKASSRLEVDMESPTIRSEVEDRIAQPPDPSGLDSNPSLALVREVLVSMRDSHRIPLVMCDADGYSYQEIADALGLGLSATKMRVKRAREEFRRLYAARKLGE